MGCSSNKIETNESFQQDMNKKSEASNSNSSQKINFSTNKRISTQNNVFSSNNNINNSNNPINDDNFENNINGTNNKLSKEYFFFPTKEIQKDKFNNQKQLITAELIINQEKKYLNFIPNKIKKINNINTEADH